MVNKKQIEYFLEGGQCLFFCLFAKMIIFYWFFWDFGIDQHSIRWLNNVLLWVSDLIKIRYQASKASWYLAKLNSEACVESRFSFTCRPIQPIKSCSSLNVSATELTVLHVFWNRCRGPWLNLWASIVLLLFACLV